MAEESIGKAVIDLVVNSKELENKVKSAVDEAAKTASKSAPKMESAFSSSMKKVGGFIKGAFAIGTVVNFTKKAVQSASAVQSAFTGLNSIVQGVGGSMGKAQKFITDYTADGLLTVTEAASAYKNLLSRGYDTKQIEDTLNRLKDSAAFGRQASYNLGEAVVSATEGLKNENSILVDNAGITKNVAKMWEEYAKSIGKTTNQLTQQEKIQAEYNGIMAETKFQVGDAATYTTTFAGRVQMLKGAFANMKTAIGKVVAPIVGAFIPAIVNAINYVTTLFNKLAGLLKMFGLEFPDVVSKGSAGVGKAVEGISGMGDKAVDTAEDIAGTGKAAKKAAKQINKAFAGVDEINVLNTNKSSDTGSNGGSSGGGISDIGGFGGGAVMSESDAVSKTAKKIEEALKPLKEINFDNLITAFNNLKEAVKPITSKLFEGLEWAYYEIFVPLARWTIEDFLPAFLNLLSGAFKVLNPLLETFKTIFGFVWEKLLKPVLSWTGDAIVWILSELADALAKIGDWMSNNQTIVEAMTGIIIGFFAAWEIYKIVSFVQNAGGVVAAIASLASPINWVAVAIGAVIAIIVLLINHWDDVKRVAAEVWQKIVDIWGKAGEFFSTVWAKIKAPFIRAKDWFRAVFSQAWENIKNAFNSVSEFFSTVWAKIKAPFVKVKDWFKDIFSQAWQSIKNVFNGVGSFFDGVWNTIKRVFTNIGQKIGDSMSETIKGAVNAVLKTAETVLNKPITAINKMLDVINTIPGVNIGKLKTFSLPRLAQGGWLPANEPRLAIVGDNKREPEIVTPESKIYEQVKKALGDVKEKGESVVRTLELHIYHHYEDGRIICQKINQAQIEEGKILLMT